MDDPGNVGPQPRLIQRPDDVEPQSNTVQRQCDVVPQHSTTEEFRAMVPQSSSGNPLPVDVQGRNIIFNLENEQAPQIGDTNIHISRPVYNAPFYQQHFTQHVTVHQTYEPAHCSSQLPAPHCLDEETLPKLPATSPPPEQAHCSSQLPASHYLYEETSPKHPALPPLPKKAHCSSQLPAPQYLDQETSTKLPGTPLSSAQRQKFSEYNPSTSTELHRKHEYVQSSTALMSLLKQRVEEIASEESSLADFANRPISTVNLAIVSKPQQIDNEFQAEGHYRRKEELYNIPQSDITGKEMLGRSRKTAQKEAHRKFQPKEEKVKQDYVEKHGNVVGVVGQAGIGKTTSAKKWAIQGLRGELCGETSYFFYIVIRHIDFGGKMTLLEFLLSTMSIEQAYAPEQEKCIMNDICNDANVVMIFDGFDEAAFKSFSKSVPQPRLHAKSNAENYLKHLAGGNLLPRARKIFTSRPTQLYKLHPSYRPRFIVQILGLNSTSQDELGRQICGDRYDDIQQKLEQNRNVFAYCYVPVNFILTLVYLMNYDGDIRFVSLTRVLAFTCGQYTRTEHLKGEDRQLNTLAKLAYDAFLKMDILFKAIAFEQAGIKESTADAFTNTSVTKHGNFKLTILDGDKVRYFSHLIWQEFFAGFYLMMIMSLDEFEKILKQLSDDRWEVVSKFVFGICDSSVFNQLEPLVPESSIGIWKQKKSLLLKFIQSKPKLCSKQDILRVCSWAHESNDPEIASSVASLLPDELDLRYSCLLPVDYENISFVIQHRAKPVMLCVIVKCALK